MLRPVLRNLIIPDRKKNTLGRLMVGYSYFQSKAGFFLRGVGEAEQLHPVQSVDEEGFLVEL